MILLLDIGNSQMFGGVVKSSTSLTPDLLLRFRKSTHTGASSDEMGLFLKSVLRENGLSSDAIEQIAVCSVVPDAMHSLRGACQKYFSKTPFILQAGVKTGLKIKYHNPIEVGSDRIANSIAATQLFVDQNVVIVDMGTATTFCAISKDKDYLGGSIIPGLRISMEVLESRTAKLPSVEIIHPELSCGRTTVESIQSGLFFGHLGAMKEVIYRYQHELFHGERPKVIGTGGFARLFSGEKIFDEEIPDLVLYGLLRALRMNEEHERKRSS